MELDVNQKDYSWWGWVQEAYVMLSTKTLPKYNLDDFWVYTLEELQHMPFEDSRQYLDIKIVEVYDYNEIMKHNEEIGKIEDRVEFEKYVSLHGHKKFVPRKLQEWEKPKEYPYIYCIDIKATFHSSHRHGWDYKTLGICFDYLRDNLPNGETISLIPFKNYMMLDWKDDHCLEHFRQKAKVTKINLAEYKENFVTTMQIFDKYFCELEFSDNKNQYEFVITNGKA